ncbi:cyclin-like protein [Leptodontidium sp. MPI-SDFR-AT-0119]|nr:cyclin-like protein [Leptodontidium sp. MPI-SDFR-AT-0119]
MTTVERYRPPHHFLSDAPSNGPTTNSSSNSIVRNIPPAVPSPPRLSRNSPPQRPNTISIPSLPATMAVDQLSQWLFTPDELKATPSMCDGLDPAEERCRRAKGVNFIIQVGILLKLPQMTIGVASTFFHRFYMRRSMVEKKGGLHHYSLAATSLFLATKTEECCRKTKEIVIAVAKVAQKNASLIIDEQSKEYWRWRDAMLLYEEQMLEVLTFDLVVKIPYGFLIEALKTFNIEENKHIRNVAWAFVNDSAMTMICLAMPPKDIALGALYFAIKFNGDTIPDDETGAPWWEVLGGSPDRIIQAVGFMNEFWSDNPLRKAETPYAGYTSSSDDLERTRRRAASEASSIISPPSINGDSLVSPKRQRDEGTEEPPKICIQNGDRPTSKRKEIEDREEEPAPKRARTEDAVSEEGAIEEPGELGEEKEDPPS